MEIVVDPNKCIGCELCVALAPRLMAMDGRRKAYPVVPIVEWSPADGDFVHHCPTYAIEVTRLETPGTRGGATTVDPTSEATTEATNSDSVRFKER
jgi:ferredoxin